MRSRGRHHNTHTEQRGAEMGRCCCVAGVNPSQPSFTEVPASHSSTSYYLASTQSFCFSLPPPPPPLLPVRCQHWRQSDKVCGILPRERGSRLCISVSLSLTFSPYLPLLAFFSNPLCFATSLIVDAADGPKHQGEQSKWVYLVMTVMMDDMSGGCLNSQEGKKTHQRQTTPVSWNTMALDCVTRAQQVGAHTFCVTNLHTRMLAQLGLLCEDVMVTPAPYLPALGCSPSVMYKNFVQNTFFMKRFLSWTPAEQPQKIK